MISGSHPNESLGPLQDGATAIVVGGGPGGAGCAIALKRLSRRMGRNINVVLYEGKSFRGQPHYNQCIGVLSPPAERLLESTLDIPFPRHLVQRSITGYVLCTSRARIILDDDGEPSYAVRRVELDDYMLEQARLQGVEIVQSRVTDLEFYPDRVIVFSESDNRQAAVVVGAFGLDEGSLAVMSRDLAYRPPAFLTTIVTKIHPTEPVMAAFGNRIHAFLLAKPQIEFGAVTPKANHLSINIAGTGIDVEAMLDFLVSKPVRETLHFQKASRSEMACWHYFKGRFPVSIARGFYGDRYVLVGDAAGLVRAFKGKGINSAYQSGMWAADVILHRGISRQSFAEYYTRACGEILSDLPYGRAVRRLVRVARRLGFMDLPLLLARKEPAIRAALFDAVSGNRNYRAIVHGLCDPRLILRACRDLMRRSISRS